MIGLVKRQVGQGVRTAALLCLAGLFGLAGAGFLTAALWTALTAEFDPLIASSAVGAGYLVIALAIAGVAKAGGKSRRRAEDLPRPLEHPRDTPIAALLEAFSIGLAAGQSARR